MPEEAPKDEDINDHRRDGLYGIGNPEADELKKIESLEESYPLLDLVLDPLGDPSLRVPVGPYAASGLRTITGTQINPYAVDLYGSQASFLAQSSESIVTGMHPDVAAWIKHLVGGDPEWSAKQKPQTKWPLSRVLPRVVVTQRSFPPWPIPKGSYWIDYANFSRHRSKIPSSEWALNVRSQFPEDSTLVLGPIMDHHVRITMWNLRYQLWKSDFLKQFDAVVCPDFSSYINDPYPQALLGERMTQIWTEMAARYGINVIPIISWASEDSLARQADRLGALAEAGLIHTVYIEWLARGVRRKDWTFHRIEAFERHLAHLPIRWMFSGVESGWALKRLHRALPQGNFHVVGIWSWMRTRFEPGLSDQKARVFRAKLQAIERMQQGLDLPSAQARPEPLTSGLEMPKLGDRRGI